MEQIILQALNFDLMPPTSYDFVKAYCSLLQLPSQVTCLAMYLAELTLIDGERYTSILPSLIATSAVALARLTNKVKPLVAIITTSYFTADYRD